MITAQEKNSRNENFSAIDPEALPAHGAPLMHAQESLFLLDKVTGGLPVYHMPQAFRLKGPLDLAALTESLKFLVERHEALRTCILDSDLGPLQQVRSSEEMALSLYDLSQIEEDVRKNPYNNNSPVVWRNPSTSPREAPFRIDLFRLAREEHVLLFVLHHVVGDMSSLGILFRELSVCYEAFCQHRKPTLPEVGLQFCDYARKQRKLIPAPPLGVIGGKRSRATSMNWTFLWISSDEKSPLSRGRFTISKYRLNSPGV